MIMDYLRDYKYFVAAYYDFLSKYWLGTILLVGLELIILGIIGYFILKNVLKTENTEGGRGC